MEHTQEASRQGFISTVPASRGLLVRGKVPQGSRTWRCRFPTLDPLPRQEDHQKRGCPSPLAQALRQLSSWLEAETWKQRPRVQVRRAPSPQAPPRTPQLWPGCPLRPTAARALGPEDTGALP